MSINFASPTMLQSVTCLSFSVFGGSLKIEFGKLQSMFNLCFSAKTLQSLTELPKREGEVSILTVIFLSLAPSPQIHFPPCAEKFFLAIMDITEGQKHTRRSETSLKDLEETVKLSLPSQTPWQGSGPGERGLEVKIYRANGLLFPPLG